MAVGGLAPDTGQIAGRDTAPNNNNSYNNNTNQGNAYLQVDIVDNNVLANVNVERAGGALTNPVQTINFTKDQHAETKGSFQSFNGVSNVNSGAGSLNTTNAYTTISTGSLSR